jgi:hypothetical protein
MGIRLCVALVALTATVIHAQQPAGPAPVANGVIVGRVIDVATKEAIPGVRVEIAASPSLLTVGTPRPPAVRVLTDAQGRFVFRQLLPGSYQLTATTGSNGFEQSGFLITGMGHLIAPYLNGGYGQRRPNGPLQELRLDQGAVVPDAVIALWKGASIDGTVVDEAGEPLVGLIVAAVRRTSDGLLTTGPTSRTDDRGMYHIGALPPGDYAIVVPQTQVLLPQSALDAAAAAAPGFLLSSQFNSTGAPMPGRPGYVATGVAIGGVVATSLPPAAGNSLMTSGAELRHLYQSTFHPSGTTFEQARVVSVGSGDEANGVDVQLIPVPAVAVSGMLLDGGVPVPHFGVRLMPLDSGDGAEVLELASSATDAQGRFMFPLVPTGQYRLFAQRYTAVPTGQTPQGAATYQEPRNLSETPGAWASGTIAVADKPVADLALSLRPGFKVSGRAVFDGAVAPPSRDRLNQFAISAVPARALRRLALPIAISQIDTSGRISIPGLSPGRYILKWPDLLPGWTVQSVTIAGRDVADAGVDVTDTDIVDLVITFTDRPSSIAGVVRTGASVTDPDASVFLFPADRTRWRDASATSRVVRTVRVDATGAFLFPAVIPGDYLVVAVSDRLAYDWPDQRLLAQLSQAASPIRVVPHQPIMVPLVSVDVR